MRDCSLRAKMSTRCSAESQGSPLNGSGTGMLGVSWPAVRPCRSELRESGADMFAAWSRTKHRHARARGTDSRSFTALYGPAFTRAMRDTCAIRMHVQST